MFQQSRLDSLQLRCTSRYKLICRQTKKQVNKQLNLDFLIKSQSNRPQHLKLSMTQLKLALNKFYFISLEQIFNIFFPMT